MLRLRIELPLIRNVKESAPSGLRLRIELSLIRNVKEKA